MNQLLMRQLSDAELILNPDGTIYHLNLHPEQVAPTIITVGDPDRVKMVSQYFDRVEFQVQKREFVTHTGYIGTKRLTVISTGIGTDNIDIVFNELDALFNIDLNTKTVKSVVTPLQFIRLGTSGCLVEELPVDTILVSKYAIGLDSLLHYYPFPQSSEVAALQHIINQSFLAAKSLPISPYITVGSTSLIADLGKGLHQGITLTATGFYAPQGRQLRIRNKQAELLSFFQRLDLSAATDLPISNLEMETAGIYGMATAMGHEAISFNALLANRVTGAFSAQPKQTMAGMIELILGRISSISTLSLKEQNSFNSDYITWEEFQKEYLSREENFKYEWVNGKVEKTKKFDYEITPTIENNAKSMHESQFFILDNLLNFFFQLKVSNNIQGQLIPEGDTFFKGKHRRPDIAYYTKEQIRAAKDGKLTVPPQFVIEVILTNDQANLIQQKLINYREAGLPIVWLIFPKLKQVQVYQGKQSQIFEGRELCSAESVIEGFVLSVDSIFK